MKGATVVSVLSTTEAVDNKSAVISDPMAHSTDFLAAEPERIRERLSQLVPKLMNAKVVEAVSVRVTIFSTIEMVFRH